MVSRPTGSWKLKAGSWKPVGGWRASAGRISHTILIQFSHHNIVKYLYGPSVRRSCAQKKQDSLENLSKIAFFARH